MKKTYRSALAGVLVIVALMAMIYGYRYSDYQSQTSLEAKMKLVSE